jgi:hypothetical protein
MRWFAEVWATALRLQAEGIDIRAVTAWSLFGATDWNSVLTRPAGIYEAGVFDIRAPCPRPTAMVGLLRDLATNGHCDHPVLDSPGWWHRPDRLHYPPVLCRPGAPPPAPPQSTGKPRGLLIVGGRGTLGQALARACIARALAASPARARDPGYCRPARGLSCPDPLTAVGGDQRRRLCRCRPCRTGGPPAAGGTTAPARKNLPTPAPKWAFLWSPFPAISCSMARRPALILRSTRWPRSMCTATARQWRSNRCWPGIRTP